MEERNTDAEEKRGAASPNYGLASHKVVREDLISFIEDSGAIATVSSSLRDKVRTNQAYR